MADRLTVEDVLGPEGLIASSLQGFEFRPEQLEMARAVERAFADRRHLLAEAGTGVGKSFAYLVPAILQGACENKRVLISTYTIALQEQLIQKDLPFLSEVLPMKFAAVLGKGRGNYLCMRRLTQTMRGRGKILSSPRHEDQLEDLARWAMETETGELQEIEFELDRSLWHRVRSDSGQCGGAQCATRGNCFLYAARRRLLRANVVVVNHALFFSDLAMTTAQAKFLGEYDMVVLDEAHTLETVAAGHFGQSVTSASVRYLLDELYNENTDRGLLALAGDKESIDTVRRAASAAEAFFADLAGYRGPGLASNGRIRKPNIVENHLSPALQSVAQACGKLRRNREEDDVADLLGLEMRCKELASCVESLVAMESEDHAYWIETRSYRNRELVTLASAPIHVGNIIRELLFEEVQSAVLTSATLATSRGGHHGFDYIRRRLGMEEGEEIQLASPFDYRKQVRLHVESKLGNPNDMNTFVPNAAGAIRHYARKTQGRCFVLFTSYRLLSAVAEELETFCREEDYTLLVHGSQLSRSALLRKFKSCDRGILLGTMSFWQGVDVAGEALSNVIITKLPFAVPDAPLTEARLDAIRADGRHPFPEYQLPEAIILFKQGFGRLIRSGSDSGLVVVLDHRIVTKSYGRDFLKSLPEVTVIRDEYSG
jgi:ATP-dependent DNA helicase DinG